MLAQYFHSMTDEAEARAALEKVGLGDRVSHLPPAPKILPQLLALLNRYDIEASQVVDLSRLEMVARE